MSFLIKRFTILILFYFSLVDIYAQSPWVNHGELYAQIAAGTIPRYADIFSGEQRNITPINGTLNEISIQAYLEYGYTERLALIADLPYKWISSTTNTQNLLARQAGSISGLGNVGLGLKYTILKKPQLLTAQLSIHLPALAGEKPTGLRTGFETTAILPTLSTGHGYKKAYYYAYIGAGLYGDQLSNDIRYGSEYGYRFFDKLWIIANVSARESLQNGSRVYFPTYEETRLYVDNQSFVSFALKTIYEINKVVGINAAANIISIRAKNLPFQRPFSLGVYYKLSTQQDK